jgi:hypothetical protein
MKIISKYFSYFGLALALCAMIFSGCSCSATKSMPDPLAGFHAASKNPGQVITTDYQNYIQTLSAEEKRNVGPIQFFEDRTGQHAISITIGMNGRYWRHILVYDKDDKRIKTIKYKTGYYQS